IDVFGVGRKRPYYPADGWHRIEVYRSKKRSHIPATIHEGGLDEARIFAAGANRKGRQPLTREDRKRAVEMLLAFPDWQEKSDRLIRDHTGASWWLIRQVRVEHLGGQPSAGPETRVGKDGK